jgi:hypothetical protein
MPLPPTPSHSGNSTAKAGRGNKSGASAGAFFHLAFIGLIGAATVIMFSVASVSFLYTGEGPIAGSRNAAAVSAEAFLPTLESAKLFPASPFQSPSTSDTPELTGSEANFRRPSGDRDVSAIPSGRPDASPISSPSADTMRSTEVGGLQPLVREPLPAAATSVTPDRSSSTPTVESSAEQPDQISRDGGIQQHQPVDPVHGDVILEEKTPAQKVQEKAIRRQPVNPNAALQRRVQKECGPITFAALRRHCIASFGIRQR